MVVTAVKNHLRNELVKNGKGQYYEDATQYLDRFSWHMTPPNKDCFCWQAFWYFNCIEDHLVRRRCGTFEELQWNLCKELTHSFCNFVSWCLKEQIICTSNMHDYKLGRSFEERIKGPLNFTQREFLSVLANLFIDETEEDRLPTLPGALFRLIDGLDYYGFEKMLNEMMQLGFVRIDCGVISAGPNMSLTNTKWFRCKDIESICAESTDGEKGCCAQ